MRFSENSHLLHIGDADKDEERGDRISPPDVGGNEVEFNPPRGLLLVVDCIDHPSSRKSLV